MAICRSRQKAGATQAVSQASAPGARAILTMPADWLLRAYSAAVERFRQAEEQSTGDARDVCIALAESANWIHTINERFHIDGDIRVKGMGFARNQTHHGWSAAVVYDKGTQKWRWCDSRVHPSPNTNPKHEKAYTQALAGEPRIETLEHIERLVRKRLSPP